MKTFLSALFTAVLIMAGTLWATSAHAYTPEDVLAAVNSDRPTPLTINPELSKAAQDKANQLISCGCFAHTINGKRFYSVIQAHKIEYQSAGENLALGFDNLADLNAAWLNSPSHRANILAPYTETGIAVSKGMYQGKEVTFVIQLFITPLTSR
jgi:uncharacterized protein YkwD